MEPILVDAKTAARLLGISRSQFDAKVAQGVLPMPTRMLGPPRWCVEGLKAAVGALSSAAVNSVVEEAIVPPVPPSAPQATEEEDWSPEL
jgi:hypothetical protein